ncbi:MAG: hypothetical protein GEU81_17535, partial [Nitriliruptorales bacterium]|nr:hypothetical protein [Nitriliruptorales bacterium]
MTIKLLGLLGFVGLALLATSCAADDSGAATREVLVDYVHDEVASSFLLYFPRDITVRAGDTIEFRQHWTGEAHSVTMGTMVDEMMGVVGPLLEEYGEVPEEEVPPEVFEQFDAALQDLPWMLSENPEEFTNQNAAQPCYLDEGGPPEDPATPCADADQAQPPFNGRQSYYNSGFIPYEGPQGNEFTVQLASDIEPGVYNYCCNLHGPFQAGTINVLGQDEEIPSEAEVARQAQAEIEEAARPLIEAYEAAKAGQTEFEGETYEPPLAGWMAPDESVNAIVSEFIPETIQVNAGEAITWSFVGGHTVSFQVPSYFSQMTVEEDGTVVFNPEAILPVNSPGHPEMEGPPPEGEGPPPEGEGPPPEGEGPPPEGEGPPPEGEGPPPEGEGPPP